MPETRVRATQPTLRSTPVLRICYTPRTLKSDLARRKRLPLEECIEIGLALTTALDHLHGHGLIHRDIKPSNVVFIGGVPKLADIGLVAAMDATMSFVGTAGYMPPEGPGKPTGDIYSLGKVLYEISVGRDTTEFPELPTAWESFAEQKQQLEFNAVVLKACATDPASATARRGRCTRTWHCCERESLCGGASSFNAAGPPAGGWPWWRW